MTYALRVYDTVGNTLLDTSTRMGRVLGVVFAAAGSSGSITNDGFNTGVGFFATIILTGSSKHGCPNITLSGTTLTWSGVSGGTADVNIVYGVR